MTLANENSATTANENPVTTSNEEPDDKTITGAEGNPLLEPSMSLDDLSEVILGVLETRAHLVKITKKYNDLKNAESTNDVVLTSAYEELETIRKEVQDIEALLNKEVKAHIVKLLKDSNNILGAVIYEVLGDLKYTPGLMWTGNTHQYLPSIVDRQ